jgi:hypothetical protein
MLSNPAVVKLFFPVSETTFRRVLAGVDGDALDGAISGYVTDVLAGQAPASVLPAVAGPAGT